MHRYERRTCEVEDVRPPSIEAFRFRDAQDVVGLAEVDRCIGWKT